jgi:hypothetical protein
MMNNKTRLKATLIGFFAIIITAWARHWLEGISESLVVTAAGLIGAYIAGDTFRSSKSANGQ